MAARQSERTEWAAGWEPAAHGQTEQQGLIACSAPRFCGFPEDSVASPLCDHRLFGWLADQMRDGSEPGKRAGRAEHNIFRLAVFVLSCSLSPRTDASTPKEAMSKRQPDVYRCAIGGLAEERG